ncbi:hypothetical protein BC937DRAFT_87607 [Endogone sp. FLAS-F59071]|nr:hypothetical protein BC937DRAFT_87607 [Endogone sp. FLAS-F59071]|eukprot:RUS22725.1 hypothetical protein BC937DRAFT_87607 [Endogone sp. FLAS-F59071]
MADISNDKERETQQILLDKLKVDLNYILHFPKTEKYLALFPKSNVDDPVSSARREVIREKIRSAMRKGELEEGAIEREFREKKKQKIASKMKAVGNGKTSKNRRKGGQGNGEEDGEDDKEGQYREVDEKGAYRATDRLNCLNNPLYLNIQKIYPCLYILTLPKPNSARQCQSCKRRFLYG